MCNIYWHLFFLFGGISIGVMICLMVKLILDYIYDKK